MMKKLYIYGAGKLAEYAAYVFENDSDFKVSGFCIEKSYFDQHPETSKKTNIFEDIEEELQKNNFFLFIAVGNNIVRERIYNLAKQKGIKLASYISSKASTWPNIEIGDNCFIGEGSVIQPFVKIGFNSILFGARIGHHCNIGDHVLLSGPTIGGNVQIGDHTFIGLNAVVLQNIEIGSKNIIGMGVSIKNSTGKDEVFSSPFYKKRNVKFEDISRNYLD